MKTGFIKLQNQKVLNKIIKYKINTMSIRWNSFVMGAVAVFYALKIFMLTKIIPVQITKHSFSDVQDLKVMGLGKE